MSEIAASVKACSGFPTQTTRITGPVSMSTFAAPSQPPFSTILQKWPSCRWMPLRGSPRCNRTRSMCCRATRPGRCRAKNSLGVLFAGIAYYDGQGFMLRRDAKIDTALELSGKTVCAQSGTTTELNVADYFRANNMSLSMTTFPTAQEARTGYDEKKCDVLTSDVSQLHAERLKLSAPNTHIILPEVISKEPLGPVVRQGDDQWFNLIKWTLYALINAEELGVEQQSIDEAMKSQKPGVRRIVGTEGAFGEELGVVKGLGRPRCEGRRQLRRSSTSATSDRNRNSRFPVA